VRDNTTGYIDLPPTPLFPFGYGLSYTTFTYRNLSLSPRQLLPGGTLRIEVEVLNSGNRAGQEVVQLYVHDKVASVARPVKVLRRFTRVHLSPGEARKLSFEICMDDVAFYGLDLDRIAEPGEFTVFVGGSSESTVEDTFALIGSAPFPVPERA
jgi:beta-glucosidase